MLLFSLPSCPRVLPLKWLRLPLWVILPTIKCWSGGEVIYDGESDGKVEFQDGGAAYWRDRKSGRLVETFADCIFVVK